jgi:peroxiredoxin
MTRSRLLGTFGGVVLASAVLGLPPSLVAQAPTRVEVSKLGPQVGELIPEFSLPDQAGRTWTRQSILGPKGALLLFFRSADWCPYCKTQLVDLQSRVADLRARGLGVAAISYDPQPVLAGFSTQHAITFTLLSDVGSATIRRFGILNTLADAALGPDKDDPALKAAVQRYVAGSGGSARMSGIPFPGTFVLDGAGRVTARYFDDYYVERSTFATILLKMGQGGAPVQAMKVSGPHVDVTSYSSDEAVAPGNRFTLAVDVAPHPGVHVYAPGAGSYKVVSLEVQSDVAIRPLPLAYPASEIYTFKPLNERVAVYQKRVTLLQDVVLEGTSQAQAALRGRTSVSLTGTLTYQACDDRVCFNPTSVPLTWNLALRPIVTERTVASQP